MNTELVIIKDKKALTDSLRVAQKFGKRHTHVIRAIREIMQSAQNWADLEMFVETTYLDDRNRAQTVFIINRDGFSLLVMGFTGQEALKFKMEFIEQFNKMEQDLKRLQNPQSTSEALLASVQLMVEHERQMAALKTDMQDVKETVKQIQANQTRPDYYTAAGYANVIGVRHCSVKMASEIGRMASRICRKRDIPMDKTPDPRFGMVNMYPAEILKEVFNLLKIDPIKQAA